MNGIQIGGIATAALTVLGSATLMAKVIIIVAVTLVAVARTIRQGGSDSDPPD